MRTTKSAAEQTRRLILDAALLMFAERGWEATTFAELGTAIGMTRGAVHHHFPDKAQLLRETLREQWALRSAPVLAPLRAGGDPESAISDFVAGYLHLLASDRYFRALAVVTTRVAPAVVPMHPQVHAQDGVIALDAWRAAIELCLWPSMSTKDRPGDHPGVFVLLNFMIGATLTAVSQPELAPRGASVDLLASELARTTVRLAR